MRDALVRVYSVRRQLSNGTNYRTLQRIRGNAEVTRTSSPRGVFVFLRLLVYPTKVSSFKPFSLELQSKSFGAPPRIIMPRRRHAFSSRRPRSSSALAAITVSPQRQRKRKAWHEESMLEAIKAVKEGSTISQAARDHARVV